MSPPLPATSALPRRGTGHGGGRPAAVTMTSTERTLMGCAGTHAPSHRLPFKATKTQNPQAQNSTVPTGRGLRAPDPTSSRTPGGRNLTPDLIGPPRSGRSPKWRHKRHKPLHLPSTACFAGSKLWVLASGPRHPVCPEPPWPSLEWGHQQAGRQPEDRQPPSSGLGRQLMGESGQLGQGGALT